MRRLMSAAVTAAVIIACPWLDGARAQAPAKPNSEPGLIVIPDAKPVLPEPPAVSPAKDSDLALKPVPSTTTTPPPGANPPPASSVPTATPMVAVELIGPDSANVGQVINFELLVRNHGRTAVTQVHVEHELPAGVRCLSCEPRCDNTGDHLMWNLGAMEPGADRRIKVNAVSGAEGELQSKASVTFSTACSTLTRVTRPKLAVSISGPPSALVGEPVTFQIKLSNTGSGPISKVILRDQLPEGLQHPEGNRIEADVGGLEPGQTRTLSLKTTAVKAGQISNEITAYAGAAPGAVQTAGAMPRNPDLECSAKAQLRVVEPGLHVRLSGPKVCLVKCEALFSIDVMNPGTAASKNIRIVNRLPEGMDFVAASDDGRFDPASRSVTWSLLGQEPGAQRVLTIKTRGTALAEGMDSVIAQADGNLAAKAELPVKVEGVPAVSLEVSDPDDPGPVGSDFLYEVRVVNQGTCPCTGIQIIAQMPEGMELRETTAPAPYKVVGQQVQFAPYAKLATKADLVYRLKVRSSQAGDVRFRVQLTCDQLQQPVLKEESSRFYKP